MSAKRRPRRARGDDGSFLPLFAVAIVTLLAMAALVVDIGQVTTAARANQSIADLAALAAGKNLGVGNYEAACEDAIHFLNVNAPQMPAINASSFCTQTGNDVGTTVCGGGGTLAEAMPSTTAGKYTVSIHFPVPATEIRDPVYGDGTQDGEPCQRMRVIVTTRESTFFGTAVGIAGFNAMRSATVRPSEGRTKVFPALWLLDPTGCTGLAVSGGSTLTIGDTTADPIVPGVVTVDSDGTTCNSNQVTISVTGTGSRVQATPTTGSSIGTINLHALSVGALCTPPACDPSDVAAGRIAPQPVAGDRATRAPVDWRYNCKSSYPTYHGIVIPKCTSSGTVPPYVDNLRTAVGTSGSPGSSYSRWSTSYSCNPSGTIAVSGNWWVDCANGGGFKIGTGTAVTFNDGNVVFDGDLSMTGGELNINTNNSNLALSSSCVPPLVVTPCVNEASRLAGFVYGRGTGSWNVTGGALTVRNSFVYLNGGYVKVAGSALPPSWVGPKEGPFRGLGLWAELSSSQFTLTGGANVRLGGTFFTPEANPFSLSGGGDWGQLNAQFVAFHLAVTGGGVASFSPDPNSAVSLPPPGGLLIR